MENKNKDISTEEIKEETNKNETKTEKSKKIKSQINALEKEIDNLKSSLDESNDKYLRLAAEYDNFRKRSQKERDNIYSDATSDAIKELLPLIDNLERAKAFTSAEKVSEGLEMILKSIPEVLTKLNITEFGEVGEQFDPNIHNAVMHEENEELDSNVVTDVFQKGYKIGDKIIRFAMVKVAN